MAPQSSQAENLRFVLHNDGDHRYMTDYDELAMVQDLSESIVRGGVFAAIARPFRLRRMTKLVTAEATLYGDSGDIGRAEPSRPMSALGVAIEVAEKVQAERAQFNL